MSRSTESGASAANDAYRGDDRAAGAESPPLRCRRLGRRFGRQWAVARVDLEAVPGEAVLLAGANGAGKTTLLRLAAGLYRPSHGELRVFGLDPTRDRLASRRRLTLVGHDSCLYPRLTPLETLEVWSRLGGRRDGRRRLEELLEEVSLTAARDRLVAGFSAGMKKRLSLLRARLEEPRLLLLDEPFAALDGAGQALVEDWIRDFRRRGRTVLLASHDRERSAALCDRAVLMDRGQIRWLGPAAELAAATDRLAAPAEAT